MKKFASFVGVCFVAMLVAVGCNADSSKSGVAVLDLDQVAKAIGWDEQLTDALQEKGEELDAKLNQKKGQFEKLLEDRRGTMGEEPTNEQQQELARFQLRANRQLQSDLQTSQQQMVQFRSGLVADFRDTLRPVAGEIAQAKGMSIVILKADPVFFVADPVDITDEMTARINEDAALKKSLMDSVSNAETMDNGTE